MLEEFCHILRLGRLHLLEKLLSLGLREVSQDISGFVRLHHLQDVRRPLRLEHLDDSRLDLGLGLCQGLDRRLGVQGVEDDRTLAGVQFLHDIGDVRRVQLSQLGVDGLLSGPGQFGLDGLHMLPGDDIPGNRDAKGGDDRPDETFGEEAAKQAAHAGEHRHHVVAPLSPLELYIVDPDDTPAMGIHHLLVQDVSPERHLVCPEIARGEFLGGPVQDDGGATRGLCNLGDGFPGDEQVALARPCDAQLAHARIHASKEHHQVLQRAHLCAAAIQDRPPLQAGQRGNPFRRFLNHTDCSCPGLHSTEQQGGVNPNQLSAASDEQLAR